MTNEIDNFFLDSFFTMFRTLRTVWKNGRKKAGHNKGVTGGRGFGRWRDIAHVFRISDLSQVDGFNIMFTLWYLHATKEEETIYTLNMYS